MRGPLFALAFQLYTILHKNYIQLLVYFQVNKVDEVIVFN